MPLSAYQLSLRDHKLGIKTKEQPKQSDVDKKEYKKIVKEMLSENSRCELKTPVCTGIAQGLHHQKKRGMNLLNKKFLKRSCNPCNLYVEEHPDYAMEHGLSISKHAVEKKYKN